MAAGRVSVEAGCVDSLYLAGVVKISGESEKRSPDSHLKFPLPNARGREVRKFADFEAHLLDDSVHLVKNIE